MRRDRRKSFRVEWNSPATIYDVEQHLERPCIVSDFSNGGAKISGVRSRTIPDKFMLRFTQGSGLACRVVWRTDDALGVEFTNRVEDDEEDALKKSLQEPTP